VVADAPSFVELTHGADADRLEGRSRFNFATPLIRGKRAFAAA
jgi:hypothetical protein